MKTAVRFARRWKWTISVLLLIAAVVSIIAIYEPRQVPKVAAVAGATVISGIARVAADRRR